MAPRKGKESLMELCTHSSILGNGISVRMLEYLSTTKTPPQGFRELAAEFLDTCRIMWSVEAGLSEAQRQGNQFPPDMQKELEKKFRQTNDDFVVLNETLLKFLEINRKGGISKGFRMFFADNNIGHMRESLSKNREALRMSALVFRWSLGDEKADARYGIGYTGLMAALDRMNGIATVPKPTERTVIPEPPPKSPAVVSVAAKSSASSDITIKLDDFPLTPGFPERTDSNRLSNIQSNDSNPWPLTELANRRRGFSPTGGHYEDSPYDSFTNESRTLVNDDLHELDLNPKSPGGYVSIKVDPDSQPRRSPRQTKAPNASMDNALLNAIQRKQHRTAEQLLNSGAKPDGVMEHNLLTIACFAQDSESVHLLLLFGANPNAFDKDRFTPLYSATKVGFHEGAKMLIKYGANPNLSAGPELDSPLTLAALENRAELVHLFMMYGGDPGAIMDNGNTALIKSISKNVQKRLINSMLKYHSDPDAKNSEGKTPLFESIQGARVDIVELLLDNGANPNLPGPKHPLWPSTYQPKCLQLLLDRGADTKKSPGIVELAASIKSIESISILLDAGVSPNVKKDGVYTPLCSAIRDNSVDIVTLLLANNADPNLMASEYPAFKCVTHHRPHLLPQLVAAGADLNSPKGIIEKSVEHNDMKALEFLLEQGVSVNDKAPNGRTALTTAIREERDEFLDILLAKGADPSIRGEDWPICMSVKRPHILKKLLPHISNPRAIRGVMEMAVVADQLESVKLLLAAGVSVEDKNGGVFSPLTTAIREQRPEIVRFLVDHAGADVNAPGEHLPIIKAIRRYSPGHTEIIEMLLAHGVDINKMYRGWNAVLQAVEKGDAQILRLLVERGGAVDLTATDENGRSVLELVAEQGWEEAATLFAAYADPNDKSNFDRFSLSSWATFVAGDAVAASAARNSPPPASDPRASMMTFATRSSCTLPPGRR